MMLRQFNIYQALRGVYTAKTSELATASFSWYILMMTVLMMTVFIYKGRQKNLTVFDPLSPLCPHILAIYR